MRNNHFPTAFLVSLCAICFPSSHAEPAVDPSFIVEDGAVGSMDGTGVTGVHVADGDGDGIPEIVAGEAYSWSVLAWDPGAGTYRQRYCNELTHAGSSYDDQQFSDIQVGDVDGDGALEVATLAYEQATVDVHDLVTGRFEGSEDTGLAYGAAMALSNLEGGPDEEIIVLTDDGVHVFRFGTPGALWSVTGVGGVDVAAGNVDADPAIEIVIATGTGSPGLVVDAAARRTEFSFLEGFGNMLDTGDADGDGMDEIAFRDYKNYDDRILLVDGDTRSVKWSVAVSQADSVRVSDIDGDGIAEVLYGHSGVTGLAGANGQELFHIDGVSGTVPGFDAGDLDGDCQVEVVLGTYYSDCIHVASIQTESLEWSSLNLFGPWYGFAMGDVNADGRTELLRATCGQAQGTSGTLVFLTDMHRRIDLYTPSAVLVRDNDPVASLAAAQLDGDPALEYMIPNCYGYGGCRLEAYDGITHQVFWWSVNLDGSSLGPIVAGDIDSNGSPEVLVGAGQFAWALQGSDGAPFWRNPRRTYETNVTDFAIGDLDSDGTTEFAYAAGDDGFFVHDGKTFAEEWHELSASFLSLDIGDVDGDGDQDLLAGDAEGGLAAFDGATRALLFQEVVATDPIVGLRLADLDGDGPREILLTRGPQPDYYYSGIFRTSVLQVRNASDRSLIWESRPLAGMAGGHGSLRVADVDDDGFLEIAVGTAESIRFFEYSAGRSDTEPPVWDGTAGATAATPVACCSAVDLAWGRAADASSPPIGYNVYRDTAPGFVPGPSNLVAHPFFTAYRDTGLGAETEYFYVVRAVDALGNEESNTVEIAATTRLATPAQPVIDSAVDVDPCALGQVRIEFSYTGDPAGIRFDVEQDGQLVRPDAISPVVFNPGDRMSHAYQVVATRSPCAASSKSDPVSVTDNGETLPAPAIASIRDNDPCTLGSIEIQFTHAGFATWGHFELVQDGVVAASPVTSPVTFAPADGGSHAYKVRAVEDGCPRSADSSPKTASDGQRVPAKPGVRRIVDTDACFRGEARVGFDHAGFSGALGHYELWRDGALFVPSLIDGATFDPGDEVRHTYTVRAVNDDCGVRADSDPVGFGDNETCALGEPRLFVTKLGGPTLRVDWDAAPGAGVASYNLYVGTVGSLHQLGVYDHQASPSDATFPDSPTPLDGCDAAAGPGTSARVETASGGVYMILVAVDGQGREGPYGKLPSGFDRHNPVVDPRGEEYFCP